MKKSIRTNSLALSPVFCPYLLEFGRHVAEFRFFSQVASIHWRDQSLRRQVRRQIRGLLDDHQQLFPKSASNVLSLALQHLDTKWRAFPTESDAERFSEIYGLLSLDRTFCDESLSLAIEYELRQLLPHSDNEIWVAFANSLKSDDRALAVAAFGRKLWEGTYPADLSETIFRVIEDSAGVVDDDRETDWTQVKAKRVQVPPPELAWSGPDVLIGRPTLGWFEQLSLQLQQLQIMLPDYDWTAVEELYCQRPLNEEQTVSFVNTCHMAVCRAVANAAASFSSVVSNHRVEATDYEIEPVAPIADDSSQEAAVNASELSNMTPDTAKCTTPCDGEFVFALTRQGSIYQAEIRAFGEKAVLTKVKGIRQLHSIVFAGPDGAPMWQLSGRGKIQDVADGDTAKDEEALDGIGIDQLKESIQSLQNQREDAATLEQHERVQELDSQIQEIATRLLRDTTPQGNPRFLNKVNNWRATIYKNLKTVYEQMREQAANQIADHFQVSINSHGAVESSAIFVYEPVQQIEWSDSIAS